MGRGVRRATDSVGAIRQGSRQADARHGPIAFRILTLPTTTASVVVGWGGVLSDTWSQAWWNTLPPAMYVTVRCYDPVARHSRAAERWW